ncbi:hypothetical protein D3C76_1663130 [compost metagenome]
MKLGKAGLHSVTAAFRSNLERGNHFAKCSRPIVEEVQAQFLQKTGLKVALHDIHLRHAVADRGTGGEYDAAALIHFLEVLAFE